MNEKQNLIELNASEMKVMTFLWNVDKPMCSTQIMENACQGGKSSIKGHYVYLLIRSLLEKGMIKEVGSVRVVKSYARLYRPKLSRPEYMALQVMSVLPEQELDEFVSYFIN